MDANHTLRVNLFSCFCNSFIAGEKIGNPLIVHFLYPLDSRSSRDYKLPKRCRNLKF